MDRATPQSVIRLKTAKHNLPPPPKPIYIYHWNRIVAALSALLLLVGLVAHGIYLLLQSGTAAESVNVVGSNPDTQTLSELELTPERQETRELALLERPLRDLQGEQRRITQGVDNPIKPQPVVPDIGQPSVPPKGTDMDLSAQRPKQPVAAPIPVTETYPHRVEQEIYALPAETGAERIQKGRKQSVSDIAMAKHSAPASESAGTKGEPSTKIEENKTSAVASDDGVRNALFRLRGVSLTSPSVSRFVLAESVVNNKPVGDIDDIAPDARGVAAVYAFSDVVGMKDEDLYYHWFRNGKQVAKVRAGVWADRWRSHSSKIINSKMKGEWRVELRNEKREILASADFDYR